MKKFFALFLFFSTFLHSSNVESIVNPFNKMGKNSTPAEQVFYLEQFGDLLNIIDDEKKRETFFNYFTKNFTSNLFTLEFLKSVSFYFLKLCIVIFAYCLLKRLGMRLLNYQMDLLANRRKNRALKNLTSQENLLILETLASLFKSIFIWVLRVIFTLLFLIVMGFSVGPLIYGVSFLGFAVTLASQNIIKDFINGILIIMDGSIAVGEVVSVSNYKGRIAHITLRSLSLRNSNGELVVLPFSSISEVINYSRNFAKIKATVIIFKQQRLDVVEEAFKRAYDDIKKKYNKEIKDDFDFLGVTLIDPVGSHVTAVFTSLPDPTSKILYAFQTLSHKYMDELGVLRVDGVIK